MRLWADERRVGTLELLLTMPIAPWEAIVGKFLASWLFLGIALVLTFPIVLTVNYLGSPDNGVILSGYVGSWLMAGAYLAVSCITSAITRSQVVSFIVSVVACLFLILAGFPPVINLLQGLAHNWQWLVDTITSFSVITHFRRIPKGRARFAGRDFLLVRDRIFLVHHQRDFADAPHQLNFGGTMQKKSLETILYSTAGIVMMLVIVVAINVIAGVKPLRADMTQEKAYTLSAGTKAILKKLDTPVTIRFYCTQGDTATPEYRLSEGLRAQGRGPVAGIPADRRQKSHHPEI